MKDLFLISRSKQRDDNCNRELRCLPFRIYILEQFISMFNSLKTFFL